MSKQSFSLLHALICEDVRHEAGTKKAFYIGVYSNEVIGASTPLIVERLAVVFCVEQSGSEPINSFTVSFEGPSPLPPFQEQAYKSEGPGAHTLVLQLLGVALTAGRYTATLVINGQWKFSTSFNVRIDEALFAQISKS